MKRLRVLGATVALVALLLTIGQVSAQGRPEIRVRLQFSRPQNLDPALSSSAADHFVYYNIFSQLVQWKPGGSELEPDLAERWETSDGKTWTFYLRRGVQFHKGYGEVTSEDVKFSFDRFADKSLNSPNAGDWESVIRIEAPDRYIVRFVLRESNYAFVSSLITQLNAKVISKKAAQEKGQAFTRDPIGSGPFIFQSWSPGDEITVTANDQYYRGAPKVGKITFVPIDEESVAVAAMERGELHVLWTRGSAEAIRLLKANKAITVDIAPRPGLIRYLAINSQPAILQDARVRQALAYAVNKKELALASGGQMTPTDFLLPNLDWMREAAAARQFPIYDFDPDRARKLLTEVGLPVHVSLLFSLRSPDPVIAQILAEQFRRVGVEVTLEGLEHAAYTRRRRSGTFQLAVIGTGRGIDPAELARDFFHTNSFPPGDNVVRYDKVDGLVDAGARERDPVLRRRIYIALMKQVLTDLPYVPLMNDNLVAAWRAPVRTMVSGINNDFQAFTIQVVDR